MMPFTPVRSLLIAVCTWTIIGLGIVHAYEFYKSVTAPGAYRTSQVEDAIQAAEELRTAEPDDFPIPSDGDRSPSDGDALMSAPPAYSSLAIAIL